MIVMRNELAVLLNSRQSQGMANCLSTGVDDVVHRNARMVQLEQIWKGKYKLIIVDATQGGTGFQAIQQSNIKIYGEVPGETRYFPVFEGNDYVNEQRLRKVLQNAGYKENDVQMCLAYLYFIQHVLSVGGEQTKLSVELIRRFSSSIAFGQYVENMKMHGLISEIQQQIMIGKYTEMAEVGIELESTLLNLAGTVRLGAKERMSLRHIPVGGALYVRVGGVMDDVLRRQLLSMVLFDIDDNQREKVAVYVATDGVREDQEVVDFVEQLPVSVSCYLETKNLFAVEKCSWERLLERFEFHIYGRHSSMHSCEMCEKQLGMMEIYKKSYGTDYDRRMASFSMLDTILGRNKVEHFQSTPVCEPIHRKEEIKGFMPGMAIVSYNGSSQLICCNS